jgi:CRP-like cAMP-binding protein
MAASTGDRTGGLLRRTELGRFLSEAQLQTLEAACDAISLRPGSTLYRQGEPADAFYLLAEGMVELRARPPGRRVYRTVELVGPGCTLGDEALAGHERRLASARAVEPCRVLALPRDAFERLSRSHPDVAAGLLRCSASCLLQTVRRAAVLTQSPAEVGLRLLLEELAPGERGDGRPVQVRVTHAQLAGILHVSRETVSRMLRRLVHEGRLEVRRGTIRIQPT